MFWNRYFAPSFCLLVLVAVLHWVASAQAYYWTIEWYDFMMHFLGGAWVALAALWVLNWSLFSKLKPYANLWNMLVLVFVVGLLWEILELFLKFTDVGMRGYWGDSAQDLVMDLIGASIALWIARKHLGFGKPEADNAPVL